MKNETISGGQAEAAMRDSRALLAAIFDASRDGIVVEDNDHIVFANDAMAHLFGYESPDELIGKHGSEFRHRDDDERMANFTHLRRTGEAAPTHYEFTALKKDSTPFDVEVSVSTFPSDGKTYIVSTLRDITERKQDEHALRESEQAQRELATRLEFERARLVAAQTVAKVGSWETDLKTMAVTWSVETFRIFGIGRDQFHETHEEFVKLVHPEDRDAVSAAFRESIGKNGPSSIQHRIRLPDGQIRLLEESWQVFFDYLGQPSRAVGTCQDISERKHSEVNTVLAPGLGLIKADPGQIEQVILNLVVNARDAMPKGGHITIETGNVYLDEAYASRDIAVQPGWYAMLAVSDNGHGMDSETVKHIFEPFFTTKEQGKGTGLGLSTVYGIVKQSGGNLWVYSEVGVGTTVKIFLPLIEGPVMQSDTEAARFDQTEGTGTILLVEDDEMVRSLARASLEMYGYLVLEAPNGEIGLSICREYEGPIHLLLTDVVMPRMGGKDLADQALEMRPEMSVLYMSGYTDRAIVHHGILDDNISFIGKPFTPDALALKVAELLQDHTDSPLPVRGEN